MQKLNGLSPHRNKNTYSRRLVTNKRPRWVRQALMLATGFLIRDQVVTVHLMLATGS